MLKPTSLLALACGWTLGGCTTATPSLVADTSSGSGGSEAASGTTRPADAGSDETTAPDPDEGTTAPSTDATGTTAASTDDGAALPSPIAFDLGAVPDAPMPPDPIPDFDCADVPDGFLSFELVDGPRGYHGLEITPDGLMIGSDGNSLITSTADGDWGVFIPGIGAGQQMDWLPDGDLAHSTSDGAVTRIGLDATTEVIRAGVNAYGVVVGPDEQIYVTIGNSGSTVDRIDPVSGDLENVVTSPGPTLHSVGFSPDGQRMYVGTIGGGGTVYYVDMDENMDPITGLQVLTTGAITAFSNWHDAIAVDACGYIYVPDYNSRNLFRVSPGGEAIVFWDPVDQGHYAHGLVWGTGEDGWQQDALYFPQPYNGNSVGKVEVGVPPADFGGTVLNAPEPL